MEQQKIKLYHAFTVLVIIGAVLLGTKVITEIKGYRFIGGGVSATNTIAVSGEGEVSASPNISTVYFNVRDEAKNVKDAQSKVSTRMKTILAMVRKLDITDTDIKTDNYSSYPKYEWQNGTVTCLAINCPPSRPDKQVLVGYEVSQGVTLTIRNLDIVNDVVSALGTAGVTDMQGPNFAIDNEDDLRATARREAIAEARTKAEVLARDLGVTLVRVVSFSEGSAYPLFYGRAMVAGKAESFDSATIPPELPQGQEKITAQVTVTYEIR